MKFIRSCIIPLLCIAAACGQDKPQNPPQEARPAMPANPTPRHITPADIDQIVIDRFKGVLKADQVYTALVTLEKGDTFEILFYPNIAPNHVANFVSLAKKGYYNGVTFHRVLEDFMAQGGDPTGSGSGGPGYPIPAEFSDIPHVRGSVSMARTADPNSAGSQFFICFAPVASLDGKYTNFGEIKSGMESVDRLKKRDPQSNPRFKGDAIKTVEIIESAQ